MAKDYFTTTQAARLLSVSADTVLKWVRAGKIASYRTPGGHFRIARRAVELLLPAEAAALPQQNVPLAEPVFQYCWNFYGSDGEFNEECLDCVAYKSRAHRCYEMRDLPEQFGPLKLHCTTDCASCDYYKMMQGRGTSVLVISRNRELLKNLRERGDDADLTVRFADSEYECAMTIDKFRPDFVVIDCSLGMGRTREICYHLRNDDRVPFTRIILASQSSAIDSCCDGEIFGWIKKPFSLRQLRSLVLGTSQA